MFVAASVGIPPLLVMAAVGGLLKMPMWVFVPTVFLGRTVRFTLFSWVWISPSTDAAG